MFATDFSDQSLTGTVSVSGGTGSFIKTLSLDGFREGGETFYVNLRTGSSNGPIVASSRLVSVNDTSQQEIVVPNLYPFTTFTFTNGGAVGRFGPNSFASVSSYTSSLWYANFFTVSSGIQSWTVPSTGSYQITTLGASGGANNGGTFFPGRPGSGAQITGTFSLTKGTILNIVVGQMGVYGGNGSGGGGGSFVYTGSIGGGGLLIAAGGGGGWGHGSSSAPGGALGGGGSATTSPVAGVSSPGTAGSKGIGQGGLGGTNNFGSAGGGAGWLSDGDNGQGSGSYISFGGTRWTGGSPNGTGSGGVNTGDGGFGGGAGWGGNNGAAGGAGGYSGGGGGNGYNNTSWGAGGGGGSYNSGTNQTNTAGTTGTFSVSHGSVIITKL